MGSGCSIHGSKSKGPALTDPMATGDDGESQTKSPASSEDTAPSDAGDDSQSTRGNTRHPSATSILLPGTNLSVSQVIDEDLLPELESKPLPDLSVYNDEVQLLLTGRITEDQLPVLLSNEINLFVAADCQDSEVERNALWGRVFPALRSHCACQNVSLNVVDLHLAESEQHCNLHMPDVRSRVLSDLLESEARLLVMIIVGDRTFSPPSPQLTISVDDFDIAISRMESADDREIFHSWYVLDKNAVPPTYRLNFEDTDDDDRLLLKRDGAELTRILQASLVGEQARTRCIRTEFEDELVFCLKSLEMLPPGSHLLIRLGESDTIEIWSDDLIREDHIARIGRMVGRLEEKITADEQGLSVTLQPTEDSKHYLDTLCKEVKSKLQYMLQKLFDDRKVQEEITPHPGIHQQLFEELVIQKQEVVKRFEQFHNRAFLLDSIQDYVTSPRNQPLVVHGEEGVGKSDLLAAVTYFCGTSWTPPETAVLSRLAVISQESCTLEKLLRSVCEQWCYLYGEHPSLASRSIMEHRYFFDTLMQVVAPERPLVIIMDGLDQVREYSGRSLRWLPSILPEGVKIILGVGDDSKEMEELQEMFVEDDSVFLQVPYLDVDDSLTILSNYLHSQSRCLTVPHLNAVKFCISDNSYPRYVLLVAHLAATWRSSIVPNTANKPIEVWVTELLDTTGSLVGTIILKMVLRILLSTKHGIQDTEVLSLLSNTFNLSFSNNNNLANLTSSAVLSSWICLRYRLAPFFKTVRRNYNTVTEWSCSTYRRLCEVYCTVGRTTDVGKTLIHYFSANVDNDDCTGDCRPSRRMEELTFLCIRNDIPVRERFFANPHWLRMRTSLGDPYDLLEDIKLYRRKNPDDREFDVLRELLQLSSYALRSDGTQLYSHFHGRLRKFFVTAESRSKYPLVFSMYRKSSSPTAPNFISSSSTLRGVFVPTKIPKLCEDDSEPSPAISEVSWFPGNSLRLASFSDHNEEIVTWSARKLKDVTLVHQMSPAQGMKVLDHRRMVVMCQNSLDIYDMQRVVRIAKIQDAVDIEQGLVPVRGGRFLIAVSASRTHVLKINTANGKTETKMQAGEDRYLCNVRVGGDVCVCGDDLQKPYPLLVWSTECENGSRLTKEFRIPHHEFYTRMSALSENGQYYATAAKNLLDTSPCFLAIYDTQKGEINWKRSTGHNLTAIAIAHGTNSVIAASENTTMHVWDLMSGSKRHVFRGHCAPVDTLLQSRNGTVCLSFSSNGDDRMIRLWNLSGGYCLAVYTPDQPITCCALSRDGASVALGLQSEGQPEILHLCHSATLFEDQSKCETPVQEAREQDDAAD